MFLEVKATTDTPTEGNVLEVTVTGLALIHSGDLLSRDVEQQEQQFGWMWGMWQLNILEVTATLNTPTEGNVS